MPRVLVTGRVVTAVQHLPVGGARVRVTPAGGPTADALADGQGSFEISVERCAPCVLQAGGQGYYVRTLQLEQRDLSGPVVSVGLVAVVPRKKDPLTGTELHHYAADLMGDHLVKWDPSDMPIPVHIRAGPRTMERVVVKRAVEYWSSGGVRFRFVRVRPRKGIEIVLEGTDIAASSPSLGKMVVERTAFGSPKRVRVILDPWLLPHLLQLTAMHEVGHAIGLRDCTSVASAMNPIDLGVTLPANMSEASRLLWEASRLSESDFADALLSLARAHYMACDLSDAALRAESLFVAARIYRSVGDREVATLAAQRALDLRDDAVFVSAATDLLGLLEQDRGRLKAAAALCERARLLAQDAGDSLGVASAANNAALLLLGQGRLAAAYDTAWRGIRVLEFERSSGPDSAHVLYSTAGLIALRRGDASEAERLMRIGLRMSLSSGRTLSAARTCLSLAFAAERATKRRTQQRYMWHSARLFERVGAKGSAMMVAECMIWEARAWGDNVAARAGLEVLRRLVQGDPSEIQVAYWLQMADFARENGPAEERGLAESTVSSLRDYLEEDEWTRAQGRLELWKERGDTIRRSGVFLAAGIAPIGFGTTARPGDRASAVRNRRT